MATNPTVTISIEKIEPLYDLLAEINRKVNELEIRKAGLLQPHTIEQIVTLILAAEVQKELLDIGLKLADALQKCLA